jgi:hypothetical protein
VQPMSIATLVERASSTTDPFVLTYQELGLQGAKPLFEQYLQGNLTVSLHAFDAATLTVSGQVTVPGVSQAGTVAVRFCADITGTVVASVALTAPLAVWDIQTSYLTISLAIFQGLGFQTPALVLAAEPSKDGTLACVASGGLGFQVAGVGTATVAVSHADGVYALAGDFPVRALPLGKLVDLCGLPLASGVTEEDVALPQEMASLLSSLSLTGFGAVFATGGEGVRRLWLEIALPAPWAVVPGVVTLDSIRARFSVDWVTIGTRRTHVVEATLGACCTVFRMPLEATVTVPGLLLTAHSLQPPKEIADEFAKERVPPGMGSVSVTYLYAACEVREARYLLACGLGLDWTITEGIVVTGLSLHVAGKDAKPRVSVMGVLDIDGVALSLEVADTGSGWLLNADTEDISLAHMAKWLNRYKITLPAPVQDLVVQRFSLAYQLTSPSVTVACVGELPFGEATVSFDLRAQFAPGGAAALTGVLTLAVPPSAKDGEWRWIEFDVAFSKNTSDTLFTATWKACTTGELS